MKLDPIYGQAERAGPLQLIAACRAWESQAIAGFGLVDGYLDRGHLLGLVRGACGGLDLGVRDQERLAVGIGPSGRIAQLPGASQLDGTSW